MTKEALADTLTIQKAIMLALREAEDNEQKDTHQNMQGRAGWPRTIGRRAVRGMNREPGGGGTARLPMTGRNHHDYRTAFHY